MHFTSNDPLAPVPAPDTLFVSGFDFAVATLKKATASGWTITATDISNLKTGTTGSILVNPNVATSFVVTAPTTATTGVNFGTTVAARDSYGNVASGYNGNIKLTSNDPGAATLVNSYTFTTGGLGADNGSHTFSVALNTSGNWTITAKDSVATNPIITGSTANTITTSGLRVTSLTPTPTGFTATFNKPFIPGDLALYDANKTTVADVILTARRPSAPFMGRCSSTRRIRSLRSKRLRNICI